MFLFMFRKFMFLFNFLINCIKLIFCFFLCFVLIVECMKLVFVIFVIFDGYCIVKNNFVFVFLLIFNFKIFILFKSIFFLVIL